MALVVAAEAGAVLRIAVRDGTYQEAGLPSSIPLTAENAVWLPVELPRAPDAAGSLVHDGAGFYLLTSSLGRPMTVRSTDGLAWEEIPAPAVGPGGELRHIAAGPGILVLGGAESSAEGGSAAVVLTSIEGGPWIRSDLPVADIDVPGRPLNIYTSIESIAVTESGFAIAGSHGPIVGAQPMLWTSRNGIDWIAALDSAPPLAFEIVSYATTGAVEAVRARTEFGGVLSLHSEGGWARPSLDASLEALAALDQELYVAGADPETGEPGMWATSDGVDWVRRSVPTGEIREFFTSPSGIVAIGWEAGGESGEAAFDVGDLTVRAMSNGRFQVVNAAGSTIADVFGEDIVQGDPLAIVDDESGEVIVEFDRRLLQQTWQRVFQAAAPPERPALFVSQDGVTWTALSPPDPSFEPFSGVFGNDGILMSGWTKRAGPQLYLVRAGSWLRPPSRRPGVAGV